MIIYQKRRRDKDVKLQSMMSFCNWVLHNILAQFLTGSPTVQKEYILFLAIKSEALYACSETKNGYTYRKNDAMNFMTQVTHKAKGTTIDLHLCSCHFLIFRELFRGASLPLASEPFSSFKCAHARVCWERIGPRLPRSRKRKRERATKHQSVNNKWRRWKRQNKCRYLRRRDSSAPRVTQAQLQTQMCSRTKKQMRPYRSCICRSVSSSDGLLCLGAPSCRRVVGAHVHAPDG